MISSRLFILPIDLRVGRGLSGLVEVEVVTVVVGVVDLVGAMRKRKMMERTMS